MLDIDQEDGPSQTYVKRCGVFLETPPEKDWDGVYSCLLYTSDAADE